MRRIWPRLKKCDALVLTTVNKLDNSFHLSTLTWETTEQEEILFMLTNIDSLAAKSQINLLTATKLVSDELGRLITTQANQPEGFDLQEMLKFAGLVSPEPPEKGEA
jgi:hypothetical protein